MGTGSKISKLSSPVWGNSRVEHIQKHVILSLILIAWSSVLFFQSVQICITVVWWCGNRLLAGITCPPWVMLNKSFLWEWWHKKKTLSKAETWQHTPGCNWTWPTWNHYERLEGSATTRSKRRWAFAALSCSQSSEKELSGIHVSVIYCYRAETCWHSVA